MADKYSNQLATFIDNFYTSNHRVPTKYELNEQLRLLNITEKPLCQGIHLKGKNQFKECDSNARIDMDNPGFCGKHQSQTIAFVTHIKSTLSSKGYKTTRHLTTINKLDSLYDMVKLIPPTKNMDSINTRLDDLIDFARTTMFTSPTLSTSQLSQSPSPG